MTMEMTILAIIAFVLLALDWLQTRTIAKNPDKWHEINPILGKHPTVNEVNVYFAICGLLTAGGIYVLPEMWVYAGLAVLSIVEGWAVVHNKKLGIGLS